MRPTAWYFGPNGTLTREPPDAARTTAATPTVPIPTARPQQTLPGEGQSESWAVMPPYDWRPLVDGTAVAYATAPLDADVTVVGPGSVDLWLRSSADDTDLQVTLTEIRPDGLETYVQSGWLRASHRKLGRKRSSAFEPVQTHLERDARAAARRPLHEGARRACSPWRTSSARARASASASRRRAATARAGRSTPRRPTARW